MPKVIDKELTLIALEKYIAEKAIPVLAEFCYKNHISRDYLYSNEYYSDTIKELITKKEAQLEILGLAGTIDKTMAIFSLKQLGWKDNIDHKIKGDFTHTINWSDFLRKCEEEGNGTSKNKVGGVVI